MRATAHLLFPVEDPFAKCCIITACCAGARYISSFSCLSQRQQSTSKHYTLPSSVHNSITITNSGTKPVPLKQLFPPQLLYQYHHLCTAQPIVYSSTRNRACQWVERYATDYIHIRMSSSEDTPSHTFNTFTCKKQHSVVPLLSQVHVFQRQTVELAILGLAWPGR